MWIWKENIRCRLSRESQRFKSNVSLDSLLTGGGASILKLPWGFCACVFTVQGGCIHGSPSICIGNAFFVLRVKQREVHKMNQAANLWFQNKGRSRAVWKDQLLTVTNLRKVQMVSRTETCQNVSRWLSIPDGDLGSFCEPHSTFEAGIDLSHFHGSFKANHLQPTITEIWQTQTWSEAPSWSGISFYWSNKSVVLISFQHFMKTKLSEFFLYGKCVSHFPGFPKFPSRVAGNLVYSVLIVKCMQLNTFCTLSS